MMNKEMQLPEDVALRVADVSKSFKLPTERAGSLKNALVNWARGIRGYRIQRVLEGLTFDVHKGDFFGIVGKNGSGKSTLLKIISGIYAADTGTVQTVGKLVPFIELGVGFNPELTGRENVYLNGAMLGFSNDEIDAMYDDIVEFAELGDFMEQKLKNYSSGMQVRLAFSVAIKSQGDILVLDEVLAVGDEAFQKKCQDYFFEAKRKKKTIILVTHSMADVRRYCNRAMFIQDGRIAQIGDPDLIADAYSNSFLGTTATVGSGTKGYGHDATLDGIEIQVDGAEQQYLDQYEDFDIVVDLDCKRDLRSDQIHIDVVDGRGWMAFSLPNQGEKPFIITKGKHRLTFHVQNVLAFGDYHIDVAFDDGNDRYLIAQRAYSFHLVGHAVAASPLTVPHSTCVMDH